MGLINSIQTVNGTVGVSFNSSPTMIHNTSEAIFSTLALHYFNYNGGNSQWNHDLFSIGSYRIKMVQNLVNIHPWLNDTNNDFLTNVNSDNLNFCGDFTLQQLMEYVSWIGLEGTQEFIDTIQNNALEQTKKTI